MSFLLCESRLYISWFTDILSTKQLIDWLSGSLTCCQWTQTGFCWGVWTCEVWVVTAASLLVLSCCNLTERNQVQCERKELWVDGFGHSGRRRDNKLCPPVCPDSSSSSSPTLPRLPPSGWLVANWELGNSVRASRLSPEGSPSLRGPRPPL